MAAFSLRHFEGCDLEQVVGIWNQTLRRDPTDVGRFSRWLLGDDNYRPGPDSGFVVAVKAGQVVGFARAIVRYWPNDRLGLEPEDGWITVLAVHPEHQRGGIGRALLANAIDYLRGKGRRRIWACGNTGSAPGYVFPGVDRDAYAGGLHLFTKAGFVVDHEPVAMSRETIDFDVARFHAEAWAKGKDITIETLSPVRTQDFLLFMAESFPGDWNIAARQQIRSGRLHEVLIARRGETIVGYCQWEGEHFGPFGVAAAERKAGIGAKLFVEAVRRIRAADGRSVWFNWADDAPARFYSRFGLAPTRRFAILRMDL